MPINYIVLRTNPEYQYDDVLNTINNNFSSMTTSFLYTSGGTIIGDLIVSGSISGGTFYGDGSNLSGVSSANYYTTASTLVGQTVFFDRNDQLSAYTLDLSSLVSSGGTDYYVTGATFNKLSSELTLSRNDGGIVTATGLTDFYTTGGTLIGTVIYFDRNDMSSAYSIELSGLTSGITFSGNYLPLSGGTVSGNSSFDSISATTISGGTIYSGGTDLYDIFSTGAGDITRIQPGINITTGGTENLPTINLADSPSINNLSFSGTAIGMAFSATTISGGTFYGDGSNLSGVSSANYYTTGGTLSGTSIYFSRNDQALAYSVELSGLTSGITTSGDYLPLSGGTVSGNSSFDSISATTLTATTIFSAGTELSLLFVQPNNTQTLTNKRITKRVVSVASSATPAFNTDNGDIARLTGLTTNITNASTNLTGTPNHGDMFSYEITDNGVARTISWGTSFAATGTLALPTTTVISTRLRCLFQYADNVLKWEIVAVV